MATSVNTLVDRAKRVAKVLHKILKEELSIEFVNLAECQETTAMLFGFVDWYALQHRSTDSAYVIDEELDADGFERRLQSQFEELERLLPDDDELITGILTALRPTSSKPPRTLTAAADKGVIPISRLEDGIFGAAMVGPATDIANRAHALIDGGNYPAAAKAAQVALRIDPECIDALEALGLCSANPATAVEYHARSSRSAWNVYGPLWERWAVENPREKGVFWDFLGSRPFLRSNMNFGRTLMIAGKEGCLPARSAYKQAIDVFTKLIRVHAAVDTARERRMVAHMARGDWKAAGRDARMLSRQRPSCYSVWTLAWVAQCEGDLDFEATIQKALTVCPFVLPLLIDGLSSRKPDSCDSDGPQMAVSYVHEVRDYWGQSANLRALLPWKMKADKLIRQAKIDFGASWGSALPVDQRRPVPEHWRL